jgi:rhamnosyl/mannosyltransferase
MRVLQVYKTYFPESRGGLEEAIRQICRATASSDVSNELFTLAKKPEPGLIEGHEARVWRYKRWFQISSCDFSGVSGMRRFRTHARNCDLIHYHFPWPFADLLHLLHVTGKPSLVTYHSDIVRQRFLSYPYAPVMKRFLSSVNAIVATSPNYAASSKVLRNYREKITVIPLGLDPAVNVDPPPALLEQWEKKVGRGFFLFIGNLRYYKGLSYLVEAVRGTNLEVVLMGTGEQESYLKQLAQGMDNLRFVGAVGDEDKFALLRLARAVVLPSHLRSEAFGVVLLEGALCGKPLITAEIGTGTSYVNVADETGYVVPPADPLALRRAMEALAANDDLAVQMGKAAQKRFYSKFTAEHMGEQYVRLYRRLLDGRPHQ